MFRIHDYISFLSHGTAKCESFFWFLSQYSQSPVANVKYVMRSHTIYLDVLRVLQQWCHHEISQKEVVGVEVEDVSSDLRDAIPVTWLH